jgi:hypothetical protein
VGWRGDSNPVQGKVLFVTQKTKVMRVSRVPTSLHIVIDQKQLEKVEYCNCLGSVITNDARCTLELKSEIFVAKAAFNKKKILFTGKLHLNLRQEPLKCYVWSVALYGAETLTL